MKVSASFWVFCHVFSSTTQFSLLVVSKPLHYRQLAKHVYIFSTSLYRAVKCEIYWKILLNEQSNLCLLNASFLFMSLAFLFKLQLCIISETSTVRFETLIKAIKQFTYLIDQSQCTRWLYIEWFSWYNTALYLWLSDIWIIFYILFYFFFFSDPDFKDIGVPKPLPCGYYSFIYKHPTYEYI